MALADIVLEQLKKFSKKRKKEEPVKVVPGMKEGGEVEKKDEKAKKEDAGELGKEIEGEIFTESEAVRKFSEGLVSVQDLIAPAAIEVDFSNLKMNEKFFRTIFVLTYPNILPTSWLAGIINLPYNLNISTFYYPIDSRLVMQKLKRKIGEFQATLNTAIDEGKIPDPGIKVALEDAQRLQELLAKNEERYFHYALYITIQADSLKELNDITSEVESTLGTLGIVAKPTSLEMEQAFQSTIPTGKDNLYKTRNMSTDAISATFPFVTSSLTMDEGVLYGLNKHNNSLVVFDRFSLENANMVVFATSGAGKSYMVKLEIYRSLMLGTGVIVIDPEREYEALCDTVGGSYISFSQTGGDKINPFDLSGIYEEGENELASKRLFLLGLLRLMLGGLSPEEKAILDRAIGLTYREKGITDDPATQRGTPPLMEDLYKILKGMPEEESQALANRLEMYIRGAAAGVFDRPTTVDLKNPFTVFSLQELSDELRPIAMYMMLDYVWTRIRKDKSKRMLVVDEAWYMMQNEDSARFLYWFAKRARKYFLGLTTITQDVEDFLDSKYGKAIVTNSSIQVLLKQSSAAIERIQKVFNLSEGEKLILLNSAVGEGLFFAGQNHVMIQVVSSEHEHKIVSTDPREAARLREKIAELGKLEKVEETGMVQERGKVAGMPEGRVGSHREAPVEYREVEKEIGPVAEKETVFVQKEEAAPEQKKVSEELPAELKINSLPHGVNLTKKPSPQPEVIKPESPIKTVLRKDVFPQPAAGFVPPSVEPSMTPASQSKPEETADNLNRVSSASVQSGLVQPPAAEKKAEISSRVPTVATPFADLQKDAADLSSEDLKSTIPMSPDEEIPILK